MGFAHRLQMKKLRADHRDKMRDVNRAIKQEKYADRLAKKQQKLEFKEDMEKMKSGYSGTFHKKLTRLAARVKHGQHELQNVRKANLLFKKEKLNMEGYDTKAHKKSLKRKHKELMQEQRGKHRLLRKKTDIHINTDVDANRNTDVDVNLNKNKAVGQLEKIFEKVPDIRPIPPTPKPTPPNGNRSNPPWRYFP